VLPPVIWSKPGSGKRKTQGAWRTEDFTVVENFLVDFGRMGPYTGARGLCIGCDHQDQASKVNNYKQIYGRGLAGDPDRGNLA